MLDDQSSSASGNAYHQAATSGASENPVAPSYYDADLSWVPTNTLRSAAAFVYPACARTVQIMETIGGVIVNTFGLNQSRFQYAVDEFHRRERARIEREQLQYMKERERLLAKARRAMDDDMSDDDGDDDDVTRDSIQGREDSTSVSKKSGGSRVRSSYVPPVIAERVKLEDAL